MTIEVTAPPTDVAESPNDLRAVHPAFPHYSQRAFPIEFRLEERHRGAPPTLIGHAAVFDQVADLGWFKERIAPGAFTRTLREGGPVYSLWNHDPNYIIASTKNGSLRLSEDKTGLLAEMDPIDTPTIRDLVVKPMMDGMVNKMSFGFTTVRDSMDKSGVRTVEDVDLFDVSPVTFPAYEGTDIQARVARIAGRVSHGLPVQTEDEDLFKMLDLLARSLTRAQESATLRTDSAGALAAQARARELQLIMKGLR